MGRNRRPIPIAWGFKFDGNLLTREDDRQVYGEQRYQSIGVIHGVCIFVAWTPRGDDDNPHLISARKAEKHEEKIWARFFRKTR
jgi:hypothetical protein